MITFGLGYNAVKHEKIMKFDGSEVLQEYAMTGEGNVPKWRYFPKLISRK